MTTTYLKLNPFLELLIAREIVAGYRGEQARRRGELAYLRMFGETP